MTRCAFTQISVKAREPYFAHLAAATAAVVSGRLGKTLL